MLAKDLEQTLESLGLSWNNWDRMFKELAAYAARKGHCCPSKTDDGKSEEYSSLARWVATQRMWYKIPGKLTEERIKRLEGIGFDWDPIQSRKEGGGVPRLRNGSKKLSAKAILVETIIESHF